MYQVAKVNLTENDKKEWENLSGENSGKPL
jgi:hypothetical protein